MMMRARRPVWLMALLIVAGTACTGAPTAGSRNDARPDDSRSTRATLMSLPVVFVPSTINYTGTADVTVALQKFIDSVADGVEVRFHKNGRYRVEGTLFVTSRSLTFEGQGATIFATTPGSLERSQWWITGGESVIFRHMIVKGANPHAGLAENAYDPKREKQHGFRDEGTHGFELDHVTVTDVYGDFVYIGRYVADPATNVWVHDSKFQRNGRQGISLVAVTGAIIERNTLSDCRRGSIDLEPNGPNQLVSTVFILNNTVGTGRLFFLASHGKGPVNDIVISGNHLQKHVMTIDVVPISGQRRKNWIVTNNTSDLIANARPIRWIETDGVLVSGNTQKVKADQPSIELTNVCGATIKNNAFGSKLISRHGPTCNATLVVPKQPVIPGRP